MTPEERVQQATAAAKQALALAQGYKAAHDRVAATLAPADAVKAAADEIVGYGFVPADRRDEAVACLADPVRCVETCRNLAKLANEYATRAVPAEVAGEGVPAPKKTAAARNDDATEEDFYREIHSEMSKAAAVAASPLV